jgi:hypothetical protein
VNGSNGLLSSSRISYPFGKGRRLKCQVTPRHPRYAREPNRFSSTFDQWTNALTRSFSFNSRSLGYEYGNNGVLLFQILANRDRRETCFIVRAKCGSGIIRELVKTLSLRLLSTIERITKPFIPLNEKLSTIESCESLLQLPVVRKLGDPGNS